MPNADYHWINMLSESDAGFKEYRLKQEDATPEFKALAHRLLRRLNQSDSPILSYCLESEFNLKGPEIRKLIRWLRFNRYPVASINDGYFLARKAEELDTTIAHLVDRARAIMAVTLSLIEAQKTFDELKRQQEIWKEKTSGVAK